MQGETNQTMGFPRIAAVGLQGLLVQFGDALEDTANRAALAFRGVIEAEAWDGVQEVTISLVSTFVRFDPLTLSHADLTTRLQALLDSRDWYAAGLPEGRRLFRIPTVYGTELAPQLSEAAALAGMTPAQAVASLSQARVRVTTIGFAPGQPYLGTLPEAWNIPRQTALTPRVPKGALVVAIRQLVLFAVSAPTGWRHVGQTAVKLYDPDRAEPFLLRPGDEVQFPAVTPDEYAQILSHPQAGVTREALT